MKRNSSIVQAKGLRAYTAYTIERTKMKLGWNQLLNFWIWTVHRIRSSFEQNSSTHNHDERELYLRRATSDPFFAHLMDRPAFSHRPYSLHVSNRSQTFLPGPSSTDSWNSIRENSGGKFLLCCYQFLTLLLVAVDFELPLHRCEILNINRRKRFNLRFSSLLQDIERSLSLILLILYEI